MLTISFSFLYIEMFISETRYKILTFLFINLSKTVIKYSPESYGHTSFLINMKTIIEIV